MEVKKMVEKELDYDGLEGLSQEEVDMCEVLFI